MTCEAEICGLLPFIGLMVLFVIGFFVALYLMTTDPS